MKIFNEFRTVILFIAKFVVFYLMLNLFYSLFIERYYPNPDPVTIWTTKHSEAFLDLFYKDTNTVVSEEKAIASLTHEGDYVLHVYEGCNGLNTAIVFLAFILAFGRPNKKALWFIPLGFLVIHIFNIARISLLFYVYQNLPSIYYFSHKYLFTAFIYIAIFILWYLWIMKVKGFKIA